MWARRLFAPGTSSISTTANSTSFCALSIDSLAIDGHAWVLVYRSLPLATIGPWVSSIGERRGEIADKVARHFLSLFWHHGIGQGLGVGGLGGEGGDVGRAAGGVLKITTVILLDSKITKLAACGVLGGRGPTTFDRLFRRGPGGLLPTTFRTASTRPISLARTTRDSLRTMIRVHTARLDGARAMRRRPSVFSFFFKSNHKHRHRVRARPHMNFNSNIVVSGSKCVIAGGRIIRNTSRVAIGLGSSHRLGKHVVNASPDASLTLVGVRKSSFPAVPINSSSRLGIKR